MSDDQRTPIPESFLQIHASPSTKRFQDEWELIRTRYELCEDLASHLVATAQALVHDDGLTEEDVLMRLHHALSQTEAGLVHAEPTWVVVRLAELLKWNMPEFS